MVIIAISVSLIVMFVESLQIVDGRFKLAMEIIEGCLTFFFTTIPFPRNPCCSLYVGIQGIQVYQGVPNL